MQLVDWVCNFLNVNMALKKCDTPCYENLDSIYVCVTFTFSANLLDSWVWSDLVNFKLIKIKESNKYIYIYYLNW